MSRVELGFRRLVAYTVGGVALLAFTLILRALFTVQTQGIPTGADSPLQTPDNGTVVADPFGVTFFNEEGDDLEPAWSPDGRYIAFVSIRDNVPTVVVRDLSANTVTPIASEAGHPIWSPDGTHLAYSRPNPQGGTDTYLTVPDGSQHVQVRLANAGDGIWSRDSQSILFSTRTGEIHIVSLNGSTERKIPIQNLWALGVTDISPDGTQVLASAATRDPQGLTGLIRIDLAMGAVTELTIGEPVAGGGRWSPDGQSVAYRTSPPEDTSIGIVRVMPAQGGEPHTITNLKPGYSVGQYDWSPDSRFVAYVAYPSASVIDGGELAVSWADGSRDVPLLPQSIVRTFSWSPDGSQIAAAVRNGDQFDIAIVRADEASLLARLAALEAPPTPSDPFQVTYLPVEGYITDQTWSPDGRYILFISISDSGNTRLLLKYDLLTNEVTQIASGGVWEPAWSPDATHVIYYERNFPESGPDLYLTDSNGVEHVKVNDGPGVIGAVWSPDSRSIVFSTDDAKLHTFSLDIRALRTIPVDGADPFEVTSLSPDGTKAIARMIPVSQTFQGLISVDLQSGAVSRLLADEPSAYYGLWSPSGQYIAYISFDVPSEGNGALRVVPAVGGEPRTLVTRTALGVMQFAWSPDSRFIAYTLDAMGCFVGAGVVGVDGFGPIVLLPDVSVCTLSWSPDGSQIALSVDRVRGDSQSEFAIVRADEASLLAWLVTPEATPLPTAFLTPTPPATPTPIPTTSMLDSTPSPFPTPTPFQNRDFYWPSRLTNDPTGNYRPAVSPDGQRIAFASERDGNWDIYVLDRSSGAEARLTDDPDPDMAPSWSPDGTRIAYQHNILDPSGPVLVDRTVMNADGSNKTVVASGSVWTGNQPPAWSPDGTRIAFNDSRDVVVVNVDQRREVARFTPLPGGVQAYLDPTWLDDSQVAFSGDGQLAIGDLSSGAVTAVSGAPRFARLPMTTRADTRIGYFALEGSSTRLITVLPNGDQPRTLVQVSVGFIQQAAWSPDGRFIAYYADDSVYVALASSEQYRDNAPLFAIPNVATGLSDLVGLSWLPDSSGFVYVASSDGQPNLFLATLNQGAIQAYVDSYPLYAPVQVTRPAVTPPPPPTMTPFATPTPVSPPGDDQAATPTPTP